MLDTARSLLIKELAVAKSAKEEKIEARARRDLHLLVLSPAIVSASILRLRSPRLQTVDLIACAW